MTMTSQSQRKVLLWFNVILAMTGGDFVQAYEILLREVVSRSISFGFSYGAARCAKTIGEYILGPLADVPILCDYIATCPTEDILERGSKLVAGSVSVVSTATSDYIYPDLAAGAAGRAAGEMVNMCEKDLKEAIARVMEQSKETDAWMQKYIAECTLGNETTAETIAKLRGGTLYFDPNQKRYFILKIIGGVFIVLVTIILIKGRSKVRKFFKKIQPKKLYTRFKTRKQKKLLKDKEMLELLYAI